MARRPQIPSGQQIDKIVAIIAPLLSILGANNKENSMNFQYFLRACFRCMFAKKTLQQKTSTIQWEHRRKFDHQTSLNKQQRFLEDRRFSKVKTTVFKTWVSKASMKQTMDNASQKIRFSTNICTDVELQNCKNNDGKSTKKTSESASAKTYPQ